MRLAQRAVANATFSSLVLSGIASCHISSGHTAYIAKYGASGRIRTSDRSVRSRVLYPAELRMHREIVLQGLNQTTRKCQELTRLALRRSPILFISKYGASGRIRTSDRSVRSRVLYPAELRMHREIVLQGLNQTTRKCQELTRLALRRSPILFISKYGASGRIRTSDRSVRSRVLYPAELRMHRKMAVRRGFEPRMQLLTAYSLSRGAPSASRPPHLTRSSELCV